MTYRTNIAISERETQLAAQLTAVLDAARATQMERYAALDAARAHVVHDPLTCSECVPVEWLTVEARRMIFQDTE